MVCSQFVFDPHVRPAVGRWIEALRQNQRRQRAPVEVADADEPEVSMRERRRSSHTNSTESSDDDEDNCVRPSSSHRDERGFPQRSGLPFESMSGMSLEEGMMPSSSIEMDILVAREVREWRDEIASSSGQDLRHRRPALGRVSGSGVLDEVLPVLLLIHCIRADEVCGSASSLYTLFLTFRSPRGGLMYYSILGRLHLLHQALRAGCQLHRRRLPW